HNTRYILDIKTVDGLRASGRARWFAPHGRIGFTPLPGDVITIKDAKFRIVRGYHNIGGWDYERYMKDREISASLALRKTSRVTRVGHRFTWRRPVEKIKNRLRDNLTFKQSEITALSRAILIGDQGMITPEIRDIFSRTGVAHLLAVSGLHVGFVAMACFFVSKTVLFGFIYPLKYDWASGGVPVRIAAIIALVAIIFYAALTGPRVPSARAAIMVGTYMAALFLGRGRDFYGAFSVALIVIVATMPWTVFEAGFQLSFVVVFAIVIFLERWWNPAVRDEPEGVTRPLPKRLLMKFPLLGSFIVISVFAAIGSTPLVIYHFHIIPMYGVMLNTLLAPLSSLVAPWGIFWSTGISAWATGVTGRMMSFIWDITVFTGDLPLSYIRVPSIPPVSVALYYAIIAIYLLLKKGKARRALVSCGVAALTLSLSLGPVADSFNDKLTVRFVDVGQGDSAAITWPGGSAMAIDSGTSYSTFDLGRSIVAPVFWRSGRTTLSALVLTHSDRDHMGGAYGLASYVPPEKVMDNGFAQNRARGYFKLRGKAKIDGRYRKLAKGDVITFDGGLKVDVLNPPAGPLPYPDVSNNRSLVLKLTFGGTKVLFTGDISEDVERWLVDSGADLGADVIKIAHHGSDSSSSGRFLKAVGAKVAVISLGYKNRFRHPGKAALQRLKKAGMKVYRTDLDGEIVMTTDGKQIEWETYFKRERGEFE
ncbi:DNA internalization-related competence protein ComEC/Rec2, partial [hydrothermal vent metagenome]